MTTLSERLREEQASMQKWYGAGYRNAQKLLLEAAAELDVVNAEVERLRGTERIDESVIIALRDKLDNIPI